MNSIWEQYNVGKDMSQDRFRGVFTIPSTPFAKNGDIDWRDLKQVIGVLCGL